MQSIFQNRRLREAAKRDATRAQSLTNIPPPTSNNTSEVNSLEEDKERHIPTPSDQDDKDKFEVVWPEGDPENPMNWSRARKWWVTCAVCLIAVAVSIPASIDGPVSKQFNEHYHVGAIAGSMTTGEFVH